MKKFIALLFAGAITFGFGAGIAQADHTEGSGGPEGCETTQPEAPGEDTSAHGEICSGDVDGDGSSDVYVGGNVETLCGEVWVAGTNVANSDDDDPTTVNEEGAALNNVDECA